MVTVFAQSLPPPTFSLDQRSRSRFPLCLSVYLSVCPSLSSPPSLRVAFLHVAYPLAIASARVGSFRSHGQVNTRSRTHGAPAGRERERKRALASVLSSVLRIRPAEQDRRSRSRESRRYYHLITRFRVSKSTLSVSGTKDTPLAVREHLLSLVKLEVSPARSRIAEGSRANSAERPQ